LKLKSIIIVVASFGSFPPFVASSAPQSIQLQVDRFIVRDSDSRLNPRDALAVAEWIGSGANLHTVLTLLSQAFGAV